MKRLARLLCDIALAQEGGLKMAFVEALLGRSNVLRDRDVACR